MSHFYQRVKISIINIMLSSMILAIIHPIRWEEDVSILIWANSFLVFLFLVVIVHLVLTFVSLAGDFLFSRIGKGGFGRKKILKYVLYFVINVSVLITILNVYSNSETIFVYFIIAITLIYYVIEIIFTYIPTRRYMRINYVAGFSLAIILLSMMFAMILIGLAY